MNRATSARLVPDQSQSEIARRSGEAAVIVFSTRGVNNGPVVQTTLYAIGCLPSLPCRRCVKPANSAPGGEASLVIVSRKKTYQKQKEMDCSSPDPSSAGRTQTAGRTGRVVPSVPWPTLWRDMMMVREASPSTSPTTQLHIRPDAGPLGALHIDHRRGPSASCWREPSLVYFHHFRFRSLSIHATAFLSINQSICGAELSTFMLKHIRKK